MTVAIRLAAERDLDQLVEFEVEIARVSFADRAVTDPKVHRNKLFKSLQRDPETLYVAVDASDRAVGWLWVAVNTNFVTGERYGNIRSLAVSPEVAGTDVASALLARAEDYAREHGLTDLTGKVHITNTRMRSLYRADAYEPTFLTMRKVLHSS